MNYSKLDARAMHGALRTADPGAIKHVRTVLAANRWKMKPAAEALGVARQTLYAWLALPACSRLAAEQKKRTAPEAKNT